MGRDTPPAMRWFYGALIIGAAIMACVNTPFH